MKFLLAAYSAEWTGCSYCMSFPRTGFPDSSFHYKNAYRTYLNALPTLNT